MIKEDIVGRETELRGTRASCQDRIRKSGGSFWSVRRSHRGVHGIERETVGSQK